MSTRMETELSEELLITIERRLTNLSPAPWKSYVEGRDFFSGSSIVTRGEGDERQEDLETFNISWADQDFIAACRQDVPLLVAEIRRLRKLLNDDRNEP